MGTQVKNKMGIILICIYSLQYIG